MLKIFGIASMDEATLKGGNDAATTEAVIKQTLSVLRELRIGIFPDEYKIQKMIETLLMDRGISFQKEYKLASRNRIDFLLEGGVGVEVKRGKPNRNSVLKQLTRYASFESISAIILVVDRNVYIPDSVLGKKCILFGLNRLWGVALK